VTVEPADAAHRRGASQDPWGIAGSYRDEPGYRWVGFAAVILFVLAFSSLVEGLSAVGNAHFFVHHPRPVVANLTVWGSETNTYIPGSLAIRGWIGVLAGIVGLAIGLGVLAHKQLSRCAGVVVLVLHAVAQLPTSFTNPLLSAAIVTLDIVAVYALTRHVKRIARSDWAR